MNDSISERAATAAAAQTLPPSAQVVQMAGGLVISRAIFAAAELGIADYLKDDSRSSEEIAQAAGTHMRPLYIGCCGLWRAWASLWKILTGVSL
jgi:hypothetical protein